MNNESTPKPSIFLLGTLPPPMGGVSVFCLRRMNQLSQTGTECILFDTKSIFSLIRLWFFSLIYRLQKKSFEIEINTSNPLAIFLMKSLGLLAHSNFIDHNSSRRFNGTFREAQLRSIARLCRKVSVVNIDLLENYRRAGVSSFNSFSTFSPYIRPTDAEIEQAYKDHRNSLETLISKTGRNIVLSSAWKPIVHDDGEDLYGIINTLEIYSELLPQHPDIQFVFLIGETDTSPLCTSATTIARQLSKRFGNFHFLSGGIPQWPLLRNTIALLRLTRTDGDSVSIREALDFGAEVIATDVCSRPPSVQLTSLDNVQQPKDILKSILSTRNQ